jgi:hypothetical protein
MDIPQVLVQTSVSLPVEASLWGASLANNTSKVVGRMEKLDVEEDSPERTTGQRR